MEEGRKGALNSWRAMRGRCTNPSNVRFSRYGGRGIRVCDRWASFEAFLADMGPRPAGMTLDRVDNDGHYEPSNCRWATRPEQDANRSDISPDQLHTFNGKTLTANAWARELGLGMNTVLRRLRAGWPIEQALTTQTWKTRRNAEGVAA